MTRRTSRATKPVEKRIRQWTHRADPLPYWWHQRCADWWHAGRDARSGVPDQLAAGDVRSIEPSPAGPAALSLGSADGSRDTAGTAVWATPRTVLLGQLGRGRAEKEWVRFHAEVADLEVELAHARARTDAAAERLTDAEGRREELPPLTSDDRETAAPGEELADVSVRVGRRSREFAARRLALDAEVERSRVTLEEARIDVARLEEPIRIRRQVAEVRVAMIESYVRRRCSAYLTRLLRKHPDRVHLGPLIRSGWDEQPSWMLPKPPAAASEA